MLKGKRNGLGAALRSPLLLWPRGLPLAFGLLLIVGLTACGDAGGGEAQLQVRGRILEVVERSITDLALLRIVDAEGREFVFVAEGFVGFTPAHLKQHQLFGQTVQVTYERRGDQLVAVAVVD